MKNFTAKLKTSEFWLTYSVYVVIVFALIALGIANENFLTWNNIVNVISSACTIMVAGIGVGMCIMTEGTDLSIGSTMYFSAIIAWKLTEANPEIGLGGIILICILAGLVVGLVNGFIIATLRMYPLLPTLATMYIFRGAALWIAGVSQAKPSTAYTLVLSTKWAGIPVFVFVTLALVIIAQIFLSKTKLGRHIYATGDNEKMAREKGVNVYLVKVFVFALAGLCAGLAGVINVSMSNNISYATGDGFEFTVITACVLGGISLNGGKGTLFPGLAIGAILWRFIYNAMVLMKVNAYMYDVVCGVIVFIIVLFDAVKTLKLEKL